MKRKFWLILPLLLIGWVLADLWIPQRVDLRQFSPTEVARLDGAMWRSYYEKKPVQLFWQSAQLMREQLRAPFWRSFGMAYHAAKAAFLFKDGRDRTDYVRALPDLEAFYAAVGQLSDQSLNVPFAARNELEWWIIRRERDQHPPAEWARLQAQIAAELYHVPEKTCLQYGQLRTKAMLLRDQKADHITEPDWQQIQQLLTRAYTSLAQAASL